MVNGGNISRVEVTVPMVQQESTAYSVTIATLNTVTVLERVGPASVTLNPGKAPPIDHVIGTGHLW